MYLPEKFGKMNPSVGWFQSHQNLWSQAKYFSVGQINMDQVKFGSSELPVDLGDVQV